MDNAPIHDEARYDPQFRTLDCLDVGLNSLLALDAEMLALIMRELGDDAAAADHDARAAATRALIRSELWDEARGIFANRLWSGAFVRSLGPTSFYPMAAGVPTAAQLGRLVAHLHDPATFGGEHVLPGVTRDDPAFADNTYWRGRIWPPLNWWVWQGLRRMGRAAEASRLAASSFALFEAAWARRLCPENYNAVTGEPLDQPDTEGFYGWGALMPAMAVGEIADVSPWTGWSLANTGEDVSLGPLESPVGPVRLAVAQGVLTLAKGDRTLLETTIRGRLSNLRIGSGRLSLVLADGTAGACRIHLPGVRAASLISACVDGKAVDPVEQANGLTLKLASDLPPGAAVDVVWSG